MNPLDPDLGRKAPAGAAPSAPLGPARMPRRRALWSLAALPMAMACTPTPQAPPKAATGTAFRAIDVTGADWGRDFELQDPQGRTRRLADFRGRLVLLFFGFTQCPEVCPTALARARQALQLLGSDAARVQVVFVTVDPERDTAELLAAYTAAFDPGFLGLRGSAAETERAAREFKVFYRKVATGASYTMDHTALSFVFDPSGRLRLAVAHEADAAALAADLRLLLQRGTADAAA